MRSGIYLLEFNNTDKVYIGQSKDLDTRARTHFTKLKNGKSSEKLLTAFKLYGMPKFKIILECSIDELDSNELAAIEVYDSINNGFNTVLGTGYRSELCGENAGNAKYTNDNIELAFNLLIDGYLHSDITNITGISRGALSDISSGKSHRWLKDKFPEKYNKLEELMHSRRFLRRTAEAQNKVYPPIVSPEGTVYNVKSIRGFAREHGLNYSSLGRVLRRQAKEHKGWKLQ